MKALRHHGRRGFVEVEPRPGGHAYVRWFRYPLGALRPDGLPKGNHDWSAALEMEGTSLSAFLARGMPSMDEFRDILDAARLLGAETLTFEHRDRPHTFHLSKQPNPTQDHDPDQ